ncbi:MAG: hypothetical protein GY856_19590, partial [bacterium]|nr:hypothetical protein [bacterium]
MAGVEVVLFPFAEMTTLADGSFSFDDIPVGDYTLTAHIGNGLQPGYEGYFGDARTRIVFAGHRPFSTIRMRGAGIVRIHTRTATSTGILTPLYYKPTYYSETARGIQVKGSYIEKTTDVNGRLELVLPVGSFEVVAYNPFHGIREIGGQIEYPGQVRDLDVLFEDASTVRGQVVDVDGRTPVPDVPVKLHTRTLLPQTQTTDAQGNFQFELVPKGGISVTAAGMVGTVERVGRIDGSVTIAGQTLDLVLQMKAQGSIRGQVMEDWNGELQPLAYAQYFVQEGGYPNRRLPENGTWFLADAQGRYEVSHLYAGRVTVVARDSGQVSRKGSAWTEITADWQVAQVPEIVMKTSVGSLSVVVRDPQTGGPVPDSQVRLSNGEVTVAGPQGDVLFDALPLGTYSVYAFNAPTGQSGRISGLRLTAPGQHLSATVYLDQRGEIHGTLFDDEALYFPVPGGTVRLGGTTTSGRMTALATTSGAPGTLGRFSFLGIPEGIFNLKAAEQDSPRRAYAEVELTETAPTVDINMVLEPVGDVYLQLYEKLTAGLSPIDLASGLFSVRLGQASTDSKGNAYDFTQMEPVPGSDVYFFPELLLERGVSISAQELAGEQRRKQVYIYDLETSNPLAGSGTFGDPYQVVLDPKGSARVWVRDSSGNPIAGANTTLYARGSQFPSVTGADGSVTFYAVPAGHLTATATSPTTGYGGLDRSTMTYDDEVAELTVTLAPAVKAHGIVYQPVPDDRYLGDPSTLVPMVDAIVEIRDSKGELQVAHTDEGGTYRFDVLPTGGYTLSAQDSNGDQLATAGGTLLGPDGHDNELPALILDAGPPRIVSLVPPPGIEGVSRAAAVEIVFSEPLLAAVLPTGQGSFYYFSLEWAEGPAAGTWTSFLDELGQQVVRFTPTGY